MDLAQLQSGPQHLLLKCISGSRAYNLALPHSDTDIKGIFVLPRQELFGLHYTAQISNETNDEVYYEIGRFIELLVRNNPNILELLSTPADCVLMRDPLIDLVRPEDFLSRLCFETFAGYAKTQIRKARGLNKKINRRFEEERKTVLDFCYVVEGGIIVSLLPWLAAQGLDAGGGGLVNLAHFRDAYALYHVSQLRDEGEVGSRDGANFRGIVSGPDANDVLLSSVPAWLRPLAVMHFNKDAYSVYCKDYASYRQWVEERNEARYQGTLTHGKNYDAKNMMHTFRLLAMAGEIATQHRLIVHRTDRDLLLRIRAGEFEYDDLLRMVEEKMAEIEELYARSHLPPAPDPVHAERLLVEIRERFY